ncbi:MAG: DUF4079 domain-containing protein [Leptolyngbyaceae cyanobacterium SL_1_1]|nr:DUF4079 domain-containing protein [Leptolyngbyaceae cyanobacterium RM2_2_21]NJO11913.1 DUF4079 domain-containing protein [Leptolyngbyaceae cyanobacterium SL_1_1]
MDLPSFLWLWRIAAWSMGFTLSAYLMLAASGGWISWARQTQRSRPRWLRPLHYAIGGIMVALVLLLLAIGIVGTLGEYSSLGHSAHLPAGIGVVALVLTSAGSARFISPRRPWVRFLHVGTNVILLGAFMLVTLTGWQVVQKYLP